jgi:hypothetical protein
VGRSASVGGFCALKALFRDRGDCPFVHALFWSMFLNVGVHNRVVLTCGTSGAQFVSNNVFDYSAVARTWSKTYAS